MNGLCSLIETYREYSLAPTDDNQIRFWRLEVKVAASCDLDFGPLELIPKNRYSW